jgi:DHA1 family bicyclomycin/chloramphenicol resistance-like MFS transporter
MSSLFTFIAGASFVYTNQFELSETQFALAFALNGLGFFMTSMSVARLGAKLGMYPMIKMALHIFLVALILLLTLAYFDNASLLTTMLLLFIGFGSLGLVVPSTVVLSLDHHGEIAGLASSLGGVMRFLTSGTMIALASPFLGKDLLPMVAAILTCGLTAFVLTSILMLRWDETSA